MLNGIAVDGFGTNPWAGVTQGSFNNYNTSQNAFLTQTPQMQQNVQNMQNQMQSFSSQYPTFPNSSGIGSQVPLSGMNQQTYKPPITSGGPGQSFNPYSLAGDANAR